MSAPLDYLPAAESFLDPVRAGADDPGAARAVVIPFGLEASVSYGGGTAEGPAAIIAASQQLELYDDEFACEPYRDWGVATLREPMVARPIEAALNQLAASVETVVAAGKFPFVLGGEHALTPGAIRPLVQRHPDLVVVQFDAHADLRDGYQGEPFSHAAAMRRVLDHSGVSVISLGIRAISSEEVAFYQANRNRVAIHWGRERERWPVEQIAGQLQGRPVYVTFDIDALDAAVMPATGTPTPDGLSYRQAIDVLGRVCRAGRVVGADLVELAPIKGLHACDYVAAALAHKILAYALSPR